MIAIPEGAPGHREAEFPAIVGLGGYLVTTAVLVVPVLLIRRRGRVPAGLVSSVVAAVALPAAALSEFRYGVAAVAAVVGAALAERMVSAWRGVPPSALLGAAIPALVWLAQLAGLAVTVGVGWSVELWFGVVVLTALAGLVLGQLSRAPDTLIPGRGIVRGRMPRRRCGMRPAR